MSHYCNPLFSEESTDGRLVCNLCPVECRVSNDQHGKCRVRKNVDGKFVLTNYGQAVNACIDTLWKRPIYLLGKKDIKSLSIGLTGCNNTCPFCQNFMVSQVKKYSMSTYLAPKDVVFHAKKNDVKYISFTFTEPIVWLEYMKNVALDAKREGFGICVKTAGYISSKYYDELLSVVDVINIDIKPNNKEYLNKCGISDNDVVWGLLERSIKNEIHTEVSHIVIEGVNEDEASMALFCEGIKRAGAERSGIHLLRHYPAWKSNYPQTSDKTLEVCRDFCFKRGLSNVFIEDVG